LKHSPTQNFPFSGCKALPRGHEPIAAHSDQFFMVLLLVTRFCLISIVLYWGWPSCDWRWSYYHCRWFFISNYRKNQFSKHWSPYQTLL